jgi:hypothetical protein
MPFENKNKSGKQKNVMSERENPRARKGDTRRFSQTFVTQKIKTKKFKEPTENYVSKSSNHRKPGTRSRNARQRQQHFYRQLFVRQQQPAQVRDGETVKKADWYNITATGKQAQILAKHVRKGDPLLIEGRQTSASGLTAKEESANRLTFSCRIFVSSERAIATTKIKPCRKQQAAKSLTTSAKQCTPRRTISIFRAITSRQLCNRNTSGERRTGKRSPLVKQKNSPPLPAVFISFLLLVNSAILDLKSRIAFFISSTFADSKRDF